MFKYTFCLVPLFRPAPKASAEQESSTDKKERPMSIMSEASNYTGGSDYSTFPGSPATTVTTVTTTSSTRVSAFHTIFTLQYLQHLEEVNLAFLT